MIERVHSCICDWTYWWILSGFARSFICLGVDLKARSGERSDRFRMNEYVESMVLDSRSNGDLLMLEY